MKFFNLEMSDMTADCIDDLFEAKAKGDAKAYRKAMTQVQRKMSKLSREDQGAVAEIMNFALGL